MGSICWDEWTGRMCLASAESGQIRILEPSQPVRGAARIRARPRPLDSFTRLIRESYVRDSEGLPPLYARGKFRVEVAAPIFQLRHASTIANLCGPELYLWDPLCLCPDGILCPSCKGGPLHLGAHVPNPRYFVTVNWFACLVGYFYFCRACRKSFRSWDPRILSSLPPVLRAEFPAHLGPRYGVSKDLLNWISVCFQHRMGVKQIAESVHLAHLVHYKGLGQQCSERVVFPPFDSLPAIGVGCRIPSGKWMKRMWEARGLPDEAAWDMNRA